MSSGGQMRLNETRSCESNDIKDFVTLTSKIFAKRIGFGVGTYLKGKEKKNCKIKIVFFFYGK